MSDKIDQSVADINWAAILTGTILRGLMWAGALVAGKMGMEAPDEATWEPVAAFGASIVLAGGATVWSLVKDKWLSKLWPN